MIVCRCVDISAASEYINIDTNGPSWCAAASHRCGLQADLILIEHQLAGVLCAEMLSQSIAGVFYKKIFSSGFPCPDAG